MAFALVLAVFLLAGGGAVLAFGERRSLPGLLWRASLAGFVVCAWCALVLAQCSRFSLGTLLVAGAAAAAGPLALRWRRAGERLGYAIRAPRPAVRPGAAAALGAVLAAGAALVAHPGEYYGGGWDPGVYLAAGASVARTGGLIVRDPLLAGLKESDRDALFPSVRSQGIKYPGFYVHDPVKATLVPQFQPLYPALLAVATAAAGGRAALFVNPVLGLAGVLLLFRLASALLGRREALCAAALLALNPVQVWNARFASSELTAQVLLLAGFALLLDFLGDGDPAAGALAGTAFALATLATVTTLLVVPFALFAAASRAPRERPRPWPFVAALGVGLAHFAAWSLLVAPRYLASVARYFPALQPWPAAVLAACAAAACSWLVRERLRRLASWLAPRQSAVAAVALVLPALWFSLRPWVDAGPNAHTLARLSWFLPPWLLLAGVAGAVGLLARGRSRVLASLAAAGCFMLFFFLHAPRMYATYPFTLRRFTPLAVPVLALAVAHVCARLLGARGALLRAGGAALFAAAALVPLWSNRTLVRQTDFAGLGAFIAGLERDLPAGGILLCDNSFLAYQLEHAAGRRVVTLGRLDAARSAAIEDYAARRWADGEIVTLLTGAEVPWSARLDYIPLFTRRLSTTRLDQELGRRPERVHRIDDEYTVLRAVPLAVDRAAPVVARADLGRNELALGPGFPVAVQFDDRDGAGGAVRSWGRWTAASAELVIPWPAGDAVELVLRAASGRPRREGARVRLSLDGEPLGDSVPVPSGMTELRFAIPPGHDPAPARRLLRIESSTWDPGREGLAGYPDGLGVLVDWVEVRPLPTSADRVPARGHPEACAAPPGAVLWSTCNRGRSRACAAPPAGSGSNSSSADRPRSCAAGAAAASRGSPSAAS